MTALSRPKPDSLLTGRLPEEINPHLLRYTAYTGTEFALVYRQEKT